MDLTWDSIHAAATTLKRWRASMAQWGTSAELKHDDEFAAAVMNDLDTPRAILRLRVIEKDVTIGALDKRAIFLFADQVLGLDLARAVTKLEPTHKIKELLGARIQARAAKNWAESDALRDQLDLLGIVVSDSPTGQSWDWK